MNALWLVWWLAAFMVVLAILTIGVAIQEWLIYRKERRK